MCCWLWVQGCSVRYLLRWTNFAVCETRVPSTAPGRVVSCRVV
jgi:hypothetical protein